MKIRSDFVTNSSSSSFILAFNTEDDFNEFVRNCKEFYYNEFLKLIKNLMQHNENVDKNRALALLENYYTYEKANKWELIRKIALDNGIDDVYIPYEAETEILNSERYKTEMAERLSKTSYQEMKARIENSSIVINGEIWDSYGGLLEWAIRNGFIENEFRNECILCWNIG